MQFIDLLDGLDSICALKNENPCIEINGSNYVKRVQQITMFSRWFFEAVLFYQNSAEEIFSE